MSSRPLAVAVTGMGLVAPATPVLPADDEGFARGRAVFETMRVYGGVPFRYGQHLDRLAGSAARVGLPVPSRDAFDELVTEALGAVAEKDVALRLYWTPGPPGGPAMGIALVSHIPGWIEELRATGQRLASLSLPRRQADWLLPGTKSTSYAVHIAAEAEAKRRGADDALFVDAGDVVLEGPVTNVWWREDDTLLTPSLDLGILAGETRAALLELAPGEGYRIEEGAFALSRLLDADEVFTSSSVREVLPAAKVDDTVFELGPAARRLQTALRRAATR